MSASSRSCHAVTRLGAPCKNRAQVGSKYCSVHRKLSPGRTAAAVEVDIAGVNQLAEELREATPAYEPPPYSPQALLAMLQQNAERLADKVPVIGELRHNLEGTRPEDLVDPETWKGLWYILNYTAQVQSKQALDAVVERLARLPGGGMLLVVKSQIESTSPKDLLDNETWKGAWIVLNAAVGAQAAEFKRRVSGATEEE